MFIDVPFEQQKQMWSHFLQGNILPNEGVVADNSFELLFSWKRLCFKGKHGSLVRNRCGEGRCGQWLGLRLVVPHPVSPLEP